MLTKGRTPNLKLLWLIKMRRTIILASILILTIFLLGCGPEQKISGYTTAKLEQQTIKNGEVTHLTVKGVNDGDKSVKVHFEFSTDKPEMVKLNFPSNMEFVLQPDEDTGNRILTVQAFTETIRTDYLIITKLVDDTGKVLHTTNTVLSVTR